MRQRLKIAAQWTLDGKRKKTHIFCHIDNVSIVLECGISAETLELPANIINTTQLGAALFI